MAYLQSGPWSQRLVYACPRRSSRQAGRRQGSTSALFRRLKSGRCKPIADAQGGLRLPNLAQKHLTLMVAWREFFSFRPEAFDLLFETIWERQNVFEPATLHDTTSCLRVLTVGFAVPILICGCAAISSEANNSPLVPMRNQRDHPKILEGPGQYAINALKWQRGISRKAR
jgi:hypothetical protein